MGVIDLCLFVSVSALWFVLLHRLFFFVCLFLDAFPVSFFYGFYILHYDYNDGENTTTKDFSFFQVFIIVVSCFDVVVMSIINKHLYVERVIGQVSVYKTSYIVYKVYSPYVKTFGASFGTKVFWYANISKGK